jgi:hypothetical protein
VFSRCSRWYTRNSEFAITIDGRICAISSDPTSSAVTRNRYRARACAAGSAITRVRTMVPSAMISELSTCPPWASSTVV